MNERTKFTEECTYRRVIFFFSRAKEENEKPKQLLILKEVREMGEKKEVKSLV